jgi:hypothetical protein
MKLENWQSYLGLGAGAVALTAIGVYLYVNSEDDEAIKGIETREAIYKELEEELSKIKKPKKGVHNDPNETNTIVYNKEFTLKVYYLLSKYATRMKKSISDQSFNKKVRYIREENEEAYKKEFYKNEKEESVELKEVTNVLLTKLKLMEQDYIMSLNFHSDKPGFKDTLIKTQGDISKELFGEDLHQVPEDLDREKATEIRDFARETTNKIIMELSQTIKDQGILQDRISFEIAKLDDIIYVKYGYKNKEVIKAFEKYELLSKRALGASGVPLTPQAPKANAPLPNAPMGGA